MRHPMLFSTSLKAYLIEKYDRKGFHEVHNISPDLCMCYMGYKSQLKEDKKRL